MYSSFVIVLILCCSCIAAAFQEQLNVKTGVIRGVVRQSRTLAPVVSAKVTVHADSELKGGVLSSGKDSKVLTTQTDADGRYELKGLPLGRHLISVRSNDPPAPFKFKQVILSTGRMERQVDFVIPTYASISGKIENDERAPVVGIHVFLLGGEYRNGSLFFVQEDVATTDDSGHYRLNRVIPGRRYKILTERRGTVSGTSNATEDMAKRKATNSPTWFGDVDYPEAAAEISLLDGEHREGVDIRARSAINHCLEAFISGATGLQFLLDRESGMIAGGVITAPIRGNVPPDGKVRICGLSRGTYRLTAVKEADAEGRAALYGSEVIEIDREDKGDIRINVNPVANQLRGRVVWAGGAATESLQQTVWLALQPIGRNPLPGERLGVTGIPIPGEFTLSGILSGEHLVNASIQGDGLYVKDITIGGISVHYGVFRPDSRLGDGELRIVIADDGGSIEAVGVDYEGGPLLDGSVALIPDAASTEAEIASRLLICYTDEEGRCIFRDLAPGKYRAVASQGELHVTPETVSKLLALSRSDKFTKAEVQPGALLRLALRAASLD